MERPRSTPAYMYLAPALVFCRCLCKHHGPQLQHDVQPVSIESAKLAWVQVAIDQKSLPLEVSPLLTLPLLFVREIGASKIMVMHSKTERRVLPPFTREQ